MVSVPFLQSQTAFVRAGLVTSDFTKVHVNKVERCTVHLMKLPKISTEHNNCDNNLPYLCDNGTRGNVLFRYTP